MKKGKQTSWLETHFKWYLQELQEAKYVSEFNPDPDSWVVFDKATYTYEKRLATKTKTITTGIPGLKKMIYTPDFYIEWREKAKGLFWQGIFGGKELTAPFPIREGLVGFGAISFIEVKPGFDSRNMTRVAEPKIYRVWEFYKIYVQIVIPEKMFELTFTPERYLFCDKLETRKRKINYPVRSLGEYEGMGREHGNKR